MEERKSEWEGREKREVGVTWELVTGRKRSGGFET